MRRSTAKRILRAPGLTHCETFRLLSDSLPVVQRPDNAGHQQKQNRELMQAATSLVHKLSFMENSAERLRGSDTTSGNQSDNGKTVRGAAGAQHAARRRTRDGHVYGAGRCLRSSGLARERLRKAGKFHIATAMSIIGN
jgi:hypothetical protein